MKRIITDYKIIQLFIQEAFDDYRYKDAFGFKNFLIGRLDARYNKIKGEGEK